MGEKFKINSTARSINVVSPIFVKGKLRSSINEPRIGRIANPLEGDAFVCGDSAENKTRVIDWITRIQGLRPVDVGPLSSARTLEAMTALLIGINRRHGVKSAHFRLMGL